MSEFDDPFNLLPHSRSSGQSTADGREIRLLGAPLLCDDLNLDHTTVPPEYQCHSWISGRYFYTLPLELWHALSAELGYERFDTAALEMEQALSAICGDHASAVGFWQDQPISFYGLRPSPPIAFTDEQWRSVGMDPLRARNSVRVFEERDAMPLERYRRGYIGWLMTNKQFLDEHDSLLAEHAGTVRRWGTQLAGHFIPSGWHSAGSNPSEDPMWPSFNTACAALFQRWRLQGLAGPYLPIPLQALMAGRFPISVVERFIRSGGVFYIPDTMPIPSRDELRGMLNDALHRGAQPEHLEEWMEIVRAGNSARNQLDRFGRLFEVQHCWRVLHDRHLAALHGHLGQVEAAFASLLGCSQATIHADRIQIKRRLGENWARRACPVFGQASA